MVLPFYEKLYKYFENNVLTSSLSIYGCDGFKNIKPNALNGKFQMNIHTLY